jgi:hypothetical protein
VLQATKVLNVLLRGRETSGPHRLCGAKRHVAGAVGIAKRVVHDVLREAPCNRPEPLELARRHALPRDKLYCRATGSRCATTWTHGTSDSEVFDRTRHNIAVVPPIHVGAFVKNALPSGERGGGIVALTPKLRIRVPCQARAGVAVKHVVHEADSIIVHIGVARAVFVRIAGRAA